MLELKDNLFKWAKSMVADLGPMELLREQASSRKYYRVTSKEKSFILAYSDPQKELNNEFIKYSGFLIKNNVSVPKIEAFDFATSLPAFSIWNLVSPESRSILFQFVDFTEDTNSEKPTVLFFMKS